MSWSEKEVWSQSVECCGTGMQEASASWQKHEGHSSTDLNVSPLGLNVDF